MVRVKEYLGRGDGEEMGKIFEFVGLRVGLKLKRLEKDEKREG